MKTVKYIERPYIIYNGRIYNKLPESIEIYNDKPVYTFIMHDDTEIIAHECHVFETEDKAKQFLLNN